MKDEEITIKELLERQNEMFEFLQENMVTKAEFNEFKDEMYSFKDEMYSFKDEMYSFKDEMYSFKSDTESRLTSIQNELEDINKRLDDLERRTKEDADAYAADIDDLRRRIAYLEKIANVQPQGAV